MGPNHDAMPMSAPSLTCGACTLCCKMIAVPALAKPADAWCTHCEKVGGGCKVFATPARPAACSEWECVWLQSRRNSDETKRLPPELRPDRTHVVLAPGSDGGRSLVAHVDKTYPDAWKNGPMGRFLAALIKHSPDPVIIRVGDRRTGFLPEGEYVDFIDQGGK